MLDGSIAAIDARTGAQRWTVSAGPPLVSSSSPQRRQRITRVESPNPNNKAISEDLRDESRVTSLEDGDEWEDERSPNNQQDSDGGYVTDSRRSADVAPGDGSAAREVVIPGADGRLYSYLPDIGVQVKLDRACRHLVV